MKHSHVHAPASKYRHGFYIFDKDTARIRPGESRTSKAGRQPGQRMKPQASWAKTSPPCFDVGATDLLGRLLREAMFGDFSPLVEPFLAIFARFVNFPEIMSKWRRPGERGKT